jgi:hypothetical protein
MGQEKDYIPIWKKYGGKKQSPLWGIMHRTSLPSDFYQRDKRDDEKYFHQPNIFKMKWNKRFKTKH